MYGASDVGSSFEGIMSSSIMIHGRVTEISSAILPSGTLSVEFRTRDSSACFFFSTPEEVSAFRTMFMDSTSAIAECDQITPAITEDEREREPKAIRFEEVQPC
jgi:hypothetical protein